MNLLLISILSVASLSLLPTKTLGTTEVQEPPQALPVSAQIQPTTSGGGGGEIWQEDDREVLIRNERGTKNNGNGSGSGKRGKNRKIKNANDNSKVHNIQQQQQQQHQQQQHQSKPSSQEHQRTKSHHQHHVAGQDNKPFGQQHQNMFKQLKQQSTLQNNNNKHSHKKGSGKAEKGEKGENLCKYVKSQWTECDPKTNTRSRTLTLKKGQDGCVPTRTIQKKCKKACRYEKGAWSECTSGQMSRTDKLKSTSDPTCQATRVVNKNCNQGKSKDKSNKERKNKGDKGARKGRA